jgi:hypothetical protein
MKTFPQVPSPISLINLYLQDIGCKVRIKCKLSYHRMFKTNTAHLSMIVGFAKELTPIITEQKQNPAP